MRTWKTKTWILLLAAVFLLLAAAVVIQRMTAKPAARAQVWVDGELRQTLDLSVDGVYRIESDRGWNVLTVRDGRVAVTAASCPDGDCIRCGYQNSGPPITCLPNRLNLRFTESAEVDGVAR